MTTPFQMMGDQAAAVCIGDVCEIPQAMTEAPASENTEHPEQAVVNRQLDENRV